MQVEGLAAAGDSGAAAQAARQTDELLGVVRARLGISLRQHKWLLPMLRQPLASEPPPTMPPPPTAPAYRALLLLHAKPHAANVPRPAELAGLVSRQIALLRNSISGAERRDESSSGSAALRRLEAQARFPPIPSDSFGSLPVPSDPF